MKWNPVRNFTPLGGSSPRKIARMICTYSRISASGLSIDCPYQPSTTGLCETPRPATARRSLPGHRVWFPATPKWVSGPRVADDEPIAPEDDPEAALEALAESS